MSQPLIGMFCGGSASAQLHEMSTYCGLDQLPLGQTYLDPNQSWSSGMWSSYYVNVVATAQKAMVTVPMLVGPGTGGSGQTTSPQAPDGITNTATAMTLTDVANGVWDYCFARTFQTIATARPDAILRIGWEIYGNGWYPWNGSAVASQHKAAFQHLVTLARTVSPTFLFDWNGASVLNGYNPMTSAYPGDSYVDFISTDVYDINSPYGANGWKFGTLPSAINAGYTFALQHQKPFCIPEFGFWPTSTGYGGGDDPAWITAAFNWIVSTPNIGYAMFFDSVSSGATPLSGVTYPNGAPVAAKLISLYAKRSSNALNGNRFITTAATHTRIVV